ncbi:MAG TPA: lysozyme [Pseudonocardiaceae bacterium]|jgi:GH25 family lysozyme M1 (1,4-beta-N-acetylmuramidase)
MRFTVRVKRGAIGALAIGTFVGAMLVGTVAPASATANPFHQTPGQIAAQRLVTHPQLDWMGSTIKAHEPQADVTVTPHVSGTLGLDVSSFQGAVNWATVAANGAKFAYMKATEGTYYQNPDFSQQYNGSFGNGLIRGAYHFATPNTTTGAVQADYFVAHGGGWSADGKTLPGLLDIEYNPYGAECYGLSAAGMVNWILSFSNEYHAKTGRFPVIYTTTDWWSTCTGSQGDFSSTNPLMLACYCASPGTMPYHWALQTIWQFADSGTFPGDQDQFNGTVARLQALATG